MLANSFSVEKPLTDIEKKHTQMLWNVKLLATYEGYMSKSTKSKSPNS